MLPPSVRAPEHAGGLAWRARLRSGAASCRDMGTHRRTAATRSSLGIELCPQPLIDKLRIGLAAGRLHHLTDKEAEELRLAGLILADLVGVGGEDLVDLDVDRAGVAGLREPALLDDGAGALPGLEHDLEHLLGDGARDRAVGDEAEELGGGSGRDGTMLDALAAAVERAEELG